MKYDDSSVKGSKEFVSCSIQPTELDNHEISVFSAMMLSFQANRVIMSSE